MRQIFRNELQRVGTESAKVLRDLGNRIKSMKTLNSTDILLDIHEAAEELQKKIDRRSYLLVNADQWEIGNRPENPPPHQDLDLEAHQTLAFKSQSETVLDIRSLHLSKSFESPAGFANESWPARSFNVDEFVREEESRTYESASALSLATFASLLIEFVARLQNLVNAFEELSEKAKFKKDADEEPNAADSGAGFWTGFKKFCCL